MRTPMTSLLVGLFLSLPAVVFSEEPVAPAEGAKKKGPASVTVTEIRGSGNSVIVTGNGSGSVKVFTRDQGKGNRVIVTHNGKLVVPENTSYKGKDNAFWTKQEWNDELKMALYWCPKTQFWFRYHANQDVYLPAIELIHLEVQRHEREVQRALEEVDQLLKDLDKD